MCEFNVILDGKIQFKEVIYVKQEGLNVVVRDVMGAMQEFKNCRIQEVDVPHARLVLVLA
ncbi:CooT family nickel-binding protein [Candidatus Bathyarchaeota archaeon]|nr:CooT family nickel-binding protein [Candidatus Bathyarchaeota archaeon]